jgi:hypothetical protein
VIQLNFDSADTSSDYLAAQARVIGSDCELAAYQASQEGEDDPLPLATGQVLPVRGLGDEAWISFRDREPSGLYARQRERILIVDWRPDHPDELVEAGILALTKATEFEPDTDTLESIGVAQDEREGSDLCRAAEEIVELNSERDTLLDQAASAEDDELEALQQQAEDLLPRLESGYDELASDAPAFLPPFIETVKEASVTALEQISDAASAADLDGDLGSEFDRQEYDDLTHAILRIDGVLWGECEVIVAS